MWLSAVEQYDKRTAESGPNNTRSPHLVPPASPLPRRPHNRRIRPQEITRLLGIRCGLHVATKSKAGLPPSAPPSPSPLAPPMPPPLHPAFHIVKPRASFLGNQSRHIGPTLGPLGPFRRKRPPLLDGSLLQTQFLGDCRPPDLRIGGGHHPNLHHVAGDLAGGSAPPRGFLGRGSSLRNKAFTSPILKVIRVCLIL